jgi:hypothetical protein
MGDSEITGSATLTNKSQRKIGDQLREQLMSISNDIPVVVSCVMGDDEAFQFASEIAEFLTEKGYRVNGVNLEIFTQPVRGQILDARPDRNVIVIGFQE